MMTVQRRALLHSVATSTLVGLLLLLHSSETWSHPGSGCWPPEIPLNSRVRHGILPFYSIGESLEYVCRYEIRGRATVTCIWDFDGIHWNHGPPTCSGTINKLKVKMLASVFNFKFLAMSTKTFMHHFKFCTVGDKPNCLTEGLKVV